MFEAVIQEKIVLWAQETEEVLRTTQFTVEDDSRRDGIYQQGDFIRDFHLGVIEPLVNHQPANLGLLLLLDFGWLWLGLFLRDLTLGLYVGVPLPERTFGAGLSLLLDGLLLGNGALVVHGEHIVYGVELLVGIGADVQVVAHVGGDEYLLAELVEFLEFCGRLDLQVVVLVVPGVLWITGLVLLNRFCFSTWALKLFFYLKCYFIDSWNLECWMLVRRGSLSSSAGVELEWVSSSGVSNT